ncbi:MAG: hypothetical protein K2X47_01250 [Bdellovibrionales bacterium]|nr:hypothetical protein [Bdellovibrionales bacterium]
MFSRIKISTLVLLITSGSAHAQFQKPGTLSDAVKKAAASVNKAMNTPPGKSEVLFDKVFGVTRSGRIILNANNRVFELATSLTSSDRRAIENFLIANTGKELAFEISAEGDLVKVRPLSANEAKSKNLVRREVSRLRRVNRALDATPRVPFAPTTVSGANQLNQIFFNVDPMNQSYMDLSDNCFNRSHYFARQNEIGAIAQFDKIAREKQGVTLPPSIDATKQPIFSEKIFVLFTDRYMKAFNHKWWYHTSPTVRVVKGGGHDVYVLDRSYMDQPVPREAWLRAFASHAFQPAKLSDGSFWDGSGCKPLKTLADYTNGSQKEMCFYSENQNMYTYLPTDLNTPNSKSDWDCGDFYELIQGIPYPNPKRTHLGGMDYNTYVRSTDNQMAWMQYNSGKFMPQDCRPQ